MKLAYLTNRYPAVSHSFIRREILAIEALGHRVQRWSIRAAAPDLIDEQDVLEKRHTLVLLEHKAAICLAAAGALLVQPRRSIRALSTCLEGRPSGLGVLVKRLAHFAEGCFLAKRLNADGIDHVHVHFGTNPTAVARVARVMGGPSYSFTTHGPDEFDQPEAIGLGGKVADAALAVAISSYGASQLMRWSKVGDWPRIAVVRCGVDETFLAGPGTSRAGLTSRRLCCVARLSPQKGLPLLIEAAAKLDREGLDFEVVIVGDGPMRSELAYRIGQLGLDAKVRLLGNADSAGVRTMILDSRAMVLPSFGEGLPVVLMESLALHRPVIATAIAGIPELVDEACGWLIPAGSVEALAEAMREALTSTAQDLEALGAEGARRVAREHSAEDNAKRLLDLFFQTKQPESSQ